METGRGGMRHRRAGADTLLFPRGHPRRRRFRHDPPRGAFAQAGDPGDGRGASLRRHSLGPGFLENPSSVRCLSGFLEGPRRRDTPIRPGHREDSDPPVARSLARLEMVHGRSPGRVGICCPAASPAEIAGHPAVVALDHRDNRRGRDRRPRPSFHDGRGIAIRVAGVPGPLCDPGHNHPRPDRRHCRGDPGGLCRGTTARPACRSAPSRARIGNPWRF